MMTIEYNQRAMAGFSASDCSPSGRTHLDLFSGIGGFALAAQAAGYSTIGFSEIEPYACKILKRHWPDVPNHGDIRNIRGVRADLITGGFPCQPFSLAGERLGAADDRHLWPEMCRVIAEARPAWVLGENVPGIVSMELDRVLSDLEGIGYAAWPLAIPACGLDARHRRERIWIVAHSERAERGPHDERGGCDGEGQDGQRQAASRAGKRGALLADGNGERCNGQRLPIQPGRPLQAGAETDGRGAAGGWATWKPEPGVGRVAHGIPARTHRLRGLGNAIVPQVAETLIRMMARMEND